MTVSLLRNLSLFLLFCLLPTKHLVNILLDGPKLFFMVLSAVVCVVSFIFLRDKIFNFSIQCFGCRQLFDTVTLEIAECRLS